MTSSNLSQNSTDDIRRFSRLKPTLGVEIGYSTINIVQLRGTPEGKLAFDKCRTVNYDPKLSLRSPSFAAILKDALKAFSGSTRGLKIWAAPKVDRARIHHLQIPKVKDSRLAGAVYWALQKEERFLEKETVVDFQVDESGELASNPNLNITGALAEREDIEDIQQAFSQAGYSLAGIGLPAFALRNLVNLRADATPMVPVMVCQLGQQATSVSVLQEQRLVFTRNIPLGLNNLAEALVKDLESKPSQEEAGKLVLQLGMDQGELSSEERQLHERAFHILLPVLERMVRQIERTLQYFQSNFNAEPLETVFIGGEIAARGYVFDFLSEQLPTNVIAIDPFDTRELKANGSLPEANAERLAYGPAFGLALEGSQNGTNFTYPFKDRQDERKQRKVAAVVSIFLILLCAVAALFYTQKRSELNDLVAERDTLDETLDSLGPRLDESVIRQAAEEVRILQEQRKAAAQRYEGLAILSEITKLTPINISLLQVSAALGSPVEIKPGKFERTLMLSGVVEGERTTLETSLAIYIARLDQSSLFYAVEVDSTDLVQSESTGELHLTFTLNVSTIDDVARGIVKK